MINIRIILLIIIVVQLISCGSKSSDDKKSMPDYAVTPLAGKISGEAWTFGAGRVRVPYEETSDQSYSFDLISQTAENICDQWVVDSDDKKKIMFSSDTLEVGETILSHTAVTFYDYANGENHNYATITGKWSIEEITAGEVTGKIYAEFDSANSVNGTFTIKKCCKKATDYAFEICKE